MSTSAERSAGPDRWGRSRAVSAKVPPSWPLQFPLPGGTGERFDLLSRVVEQEVIPRLVLARGSGAIAAPALAADRECSFDTGAVREFAGLVVARSAASVCSHVDTLRARGATLEALYLRLFAPAARWLGELWEEDRADFTEVTVGLLRLMQVLHEVGPAFRDEAAQPAHGRRALLLPAPGDQHTFGLAMVSDFFRRAGWTVWNPPAASAGDLARLVRRERFAVVGFSVSCERWLDVAAAAIRAIRDASCNPGIGIMVGGPLFAQHPELVARVGADATASDGRQAVLQAQGLLTQVAKQRR